MVELSKFYDREKYKWFTRVLLESFYRPYSARNFAGWVTVWARSAEDAEAYANEKVQRRRWEPGIQVEPEDIIVLACDDGGYITSVPGELLTIRPCKEGIT